MKWRNGYTRQCWVAALVAALLLMAGGSRAQVNDRGDDQTQQLMAAAERVMSTLSDGLIGHSTGHFFSAFDRDQMQDYSSFADQVRTFFGQHDNFKVHYQIVEVRATSDRMAAVTANVELEGDDVNSDVPGVSRNGQLHLTLSPGKQGWRITDLQPREFFQ
jgi:hypothetical protein